ncbi:MAG: ATP-binding protein [Bacteroidaceae bacterium]|nr:ATP-binding protein [Bacteroidaceae bacterium]
MKTKYIRRELSAAMEEAYRYFSVITVTGPRQSGKTTLIRNLFSDLPYYSLENLDVRGFAENDPVAFLNQHTQGMILDEVHNAPHLLSYIQGMVDDNPDLRFILSGSSQFAMLKKVTQSLAGRTAVFELLPLSYSEIQDMAVEMPLDKLLFDGFYPAIYAGRNVPKFLYPAYMKTYLDKDVRDLLQIKDMMQFHTFVRLCAGRIGSLFNASELANEIGVSSHTITSWLSVLQASYIIALLPPYFKSTRKRLTKTPKLYFTDTGLACHLLGIESPKQLARDKMRGALFENFVVMEALKHRYNQGKESNLYFYRDSNQNEVDLLLDKGQEFYGIEIKSSMTYHTGFEKALKQMNNWIEAPVQGKAVIYAGTFENTAGEIKLLNYSHLDEVLGV